MLKELIYRLKRPYHLVKTGLLTGLPAQIKYKFPAKKLKIITFTGTDGKTTSSTMMYHVLKAAGKKVALLSTVAAYIGDQAIDTGFHVTSPNPADLQRFMRMMVDEGYEYLVLEVTSHGVFQYRTWGVTPYLAGLTNVTHEHLDYHLSYDNYIEAKSLLLRQAEVIVLNADDHSFSKMKRKLKDRARAIVEYSTSIKLPRAITQAITERFSEAYNQMNARLVATSALQLGLKPAAIAEGITQFPGVPGRMQAVSLPKNVGFEVIVDFAHTPNALAGALTALKAKLSSRRKAGRLIAIFGCAGLRDRTKRPLMGRAAAEIADLVIFTAEDPRTEDVWAIIQQMKQDLAGTHAKVISIANRQEALVYTLKTLAKPGDIIGIFGKGHEQSMCYGTTEYPWNDVVAVTEIMSQ
ncbi:MAG TPA: UDP-N-acetylmuramoyl-L-alanyl-D-glutamate--2,6-diaminopimelate ligase [Vitreimonas sp.]|nr:UDP-N-acetylmuramoyl-L-alanyl-D-glutamate--2,6-diaminopimelate ligase [Vitreimonas sp.]